LVLCATEYGITAVDPVAARTIAISANRTNSELPRLAELVNNGEPPRPDRTAYFGQKESCRRCTTIIRGQQSSFLTHNILKPNITSHLPKYTAEAALEGLCMFA
jgi:hypothetical protein